MYGLEELHLAQAKKPAADFFAGTVYTGAVDMLNIKQALFGVLRGAGGVGTSTFTVEKSADSAFTTPVSIPFEYKVTSAAGDDFGPRTKATSAGFTISAGADKTVAIGVRRSQLGSGYRYVRVKAVEVDDGPVDGAIVVLAIDPRNSGEQNIV